MAQHEIILSGFGGQGIQAAGKLIAYAAMLESKYVSFLPSYGAEMRGGTSNCHVIISDDPTKVNTMDLRNIYVCETILGGKTVYRKNQFTE